MKNFSQVENIKNKATLQYIDLGGLEIHTSKLLGFLPTYDL